MQLRSRWIQQYGPVLQFFVGNRRAILFADAEFASAIMNDRPSSSLASSSSNSNVTLSEKERADPYRPTASSGRFIKSRSTRRVFGAASPRGLLVLEGLHWKYHRQIAKKAFYRAQMEALVKIVRQCGTRMVDIWITKSHTKSSSLMLHPSSSSCSLDLSNSNPTTSDYNNNTTSVNGDNTIYACPSSSSIASSVSANELLLTFAENIPSCFSCMTMDVLGLSQLGYDFNTIGSLQQCETGYDVDAPKSTGVHPYSVMVGRLTKLMMPLTFVPEPLWPLFDWAGKLKRWMVKRRLIWGSFWNSRRSGVVVGDGEDGKEEENARKRELEEKLKEVDLEMMTFTECSSNIQNIAREILKDRREKMKVKQAQDKTAPSPGTENTIRSRSESCSSWEKINLEDAVNSQDIIEKEDGKRKDQPTITEKKDEENVPDLLELMLESQREADEKIASGCTEHVWRLSDDEIVDEIALFFLAGHETTSNTLSWIVYELCKQPDEVVERLRIEVLDLANRCGAFDRASSRTASRRGSSISRRSSCNSTGGPIICPDLKFEDLGQLKYMDYVIKEVMRLHPTVSAHVRLAREDVVLEGTQTGRKVFVPKDTTVTIALECIFSNEKNFPCPDEFIPERWDPKYQKKKRKGDRRHSLKKENSDYVIHEAECDDDEDGDEGLWDPPMPGSYTPFGDGQRQCIGQQFAIIEMKIMLMILVTRFKSFRLQKGHPKIEPRQALTVKPSVDFNVVFENL
eukprot:Nk52_evm20s2325 gene=Nk52_evmTU20s2325